MSGTREFITTDGFISDEKQILKIITGYLGGSTAFPIHILRDTYKDRKPNARKVHILVVSDEGLRPCLTRMRRIIPVGIFPK